MARAVRCRMVGAGAVQRLLPSVFHCAGRDMDSVVFASLVQAADIPRDRGHTDYFRGASGATVVAVQGDSRATWVRSGFRNDSSIRGRCTWLVEHGSGPHALGRAAALLASGRAALSRPNGNTA